MSELELEYRKLIENIIESEISEEFKSWIKWRLMKIEAPDPMDNDGFIPMSEQELEQAGIKQC